MLDLKSLKKANEKQEKREKDLKKRLNKIRWTPYLATAFAEGFCEGENATEEQQLEAWQYLVNTGLAYQLQGWFGRTANALIEEGLINPRQ